jgi:endonuclease V-like protein UPF0215 family
VDHHPHGRVDGLAFGGCTVGGTDATAAVVRLFDRLGREDVRRLLLAGIAPARFNLLDLDAIHAATDRPTIAVSFAESPGLEPALRAAFDGDALAGRLAIYRSLPDRRRVETDAGPLFVRAVGTDHDDAARIVRTLTADRRPEPLRVAGIAAAAHREAADRGDEDGDGGGDGNEGGHVPG